MRFDLKVWGLFNGYVGVCSQWSSRAVMCDSLPAFARSGRPLPYHLHGHGALADDGVSSVFKVLDGLSACTICRRRQCRASRRRRDA